MLRIFSCIYAIKNAAWVSNITFPMNLCAPRLCNNCILHQEKDSLQVLEEAIQAAALEADFTFPDDSSSSQGDHSAVIDDIIESLESDALEAEQEALAVRQAEEEAQVSFSVSMK